ncbi:MAG: glycosyltransferase family 4 protein [Ignavibacteriaceae bacterium]
MKPNIAIYLQHYLSPSMTFIYRQILGVRNVVNPLVFASHKVENMNLFPFEKIYFKQRNLLKVKTSSLFTKIYGQHKLLARKPKISYNQKKYFVKKMSNDDIKIIHAHFGPSGIEILPVAKHLNIPLIVSFHGYDGSILLKFEDYKKKLKRLFEYSYVIVPSHYMLEELNEKIGNLNNCSIVNYGIPLDDFRYVERTSVKKKVDSGETLTFLQVSNFVEKKGHFYTVSAFKELLNIYSNAQLILAGEGYLKGEIQELVNNLGLTKKVIFPGAVNHNQVSIFMSKADLFLHHSITSSQGDKEGIPNVIMEAMATGLPCISTKHAGIRELIKDEVNGLLVAERDINGYVRKMKELLEKENDFSSQARKTIENDFNLEIQVKKLKKIYSGLINSKYS